MTCEHAEAAGGVHVGRRLARASLWTLAAVLHFAYRVTHFDVFSLAGAIAQTPGLAAVVALPALVPYLR
jgi:hypothetical protein